MRLRSAVVENGKGLRLPLDFTIIECNGPHMTRKSIKENEIGVR